MILALLFALLGLWGVWHDNLAVAWIGVLLAGFFWWNAYRLERRNHE